MNIIYYTFSTIPQVLAASIALFGVFCLYKIQDYNNQLKGWAGAYLLEFERSPINKKKVMDKDPRLISRLSKAVEKTHIPDIQEALEDIVKALPTDSFKIGLEIFNEKIAKRKSLANSAKSCIVFSVIVIILSLIPLPLNNYFCECTEIFLSYVGIILAIISLIWIGRIIFVSLTLDENRTPKFYKK